MKDTTYQIFFSNEDIFKSRNDDETCPIFGWLITFQLIFKLRISCKNYKLPVKICFIDNKKFSGLCIKL